MKTNAERFDRGKWWFTSKESKAFVQQRNGLVKSNGNELKEVIHITPSSSKNDQLKLQFRDKDKPLMFTITTFDFTGNDYSRAFEPYVQSKERFAAKFNSLREGNAVKDVSAVSVLANEDNANAVTVDSPNEAEPTLSEKDSINESSVEEINVAESPLLLVRDTVSPPTNILPGNTTLPLGKRKHAGTAQVPVEVEPLPDELAEKRARKVEKLTRNPKEQDSAFYEMVMREYAIKE
ncbi:Hypothetical predicted protein, partial [Paramuricea clavata]